MQRFTDLKVWQRSQALAVEVYRVTSGLPSEERFGLTGQLRRASVSVPANIAEGSLAEAESLMLLARDLGYLAQETTASCIAEIGEIARMRHGLRTKVVAGKHRSRRAGP
jgi:hypothetical protein